MRHTESRRRKKTEEGSVEAEEATFSALYNYLLATDGSSERYPTGYNKKQKRGLRRKAKRFIALTLPRWRTQVQFQLCCFIHSWFLYFSKWPWLLPPDNRWRLPPLNGYCHRIGGNKATNWLLTPVGGITSHELVSSPDTKFFARALRPCRKIGSGHVHR